MIRKILHKPQALLGLAMMLIVFFVVAFAPFIAPHDPSELNVAHALSAPDSEYYPRFRHCDVYGRYHSCDAFRENNRDSLQTAKLFGFS